MSPLPLHKHTSTPFKLPLTIRGSSVLYQKPQPNDISFVPNTPHFLLLNLQAYFFPLLVNFPYLVPSFTQPLCSRLIQLIAKK